jgi:DNA-binding protein HU-beta
MKKADLVNEVAEVAQTKKQAAEAIEIFLGVIKKTLKKRDKIFISMFGTFSIVKRKASLSSIFIIYISMGLL